MRLPLLALPLSFAPTLVVLLCFGIISPARANSKRLCLEDQETKLLQLKNGLSYNSSLSTKLVTWNQGTDCCVWVGVTCNHGGYIIGLDLSDESIVRGIDNSSLFSLQFLESLDLSSNNFVGAKIPFEFNNLTCLTSLRLWETSFSGQIPSLSRLRRLTELCISPTYYAEEFQLELVNPNLKSLVQNLTELTELSLDAVNISSQGSEWSQVLSSSLPNLQVLSLSYCSLSRPIHFSLSNLSSLSTIYLPGNNLIGEFPKEILSPSLEVLDLSENILLGGSLPQFPKNLSLSELSLSGTKFSGALPDSLGNLVMLQKLELSNCNFIGLIPNSIMQLSELHELYLSHNMFDGPIPSFEGLSHPYLVDLSSNSFNGSLPSISLGSNLSSWGYLDLSNNQLKGEITTWIRGNDTDDVFYLNLSCNFFIGLQNSDVLPLGIDVLDLHSNWLQGEIPLLPYEARYVDLSSNNFSFSIPIDIGESLFFFSASNNHLIGTISKSMCNLSYLQVLDVSNNSLSGKIPTCLLEMEHLVALNLAENNFTGKIPGAFSRSCGLQILNLKGNILEGQIPKSLTNCSELKILDLRNNQLNDTFPLFLRESPQLHILLLQGNNLHGTMQCEQSDSWPKLQIVSIAFNYFTGDISPYCFLSFKGFIDVEHLRLYQVHIDLYRAIDIPLSVRVLDYYDQDKVVVANKWIEMTLSKIWTSFTLIDFSSNNFSGIIPETIGNLNSLHSLNLSNNSFKGTIPTSFGNLKDLEVLDLSLNELSGEIPTELSSLTFLSSLNLSYNQLVGMIPQGTQLGTFNATSFEGNKGLYGCPLERGCKRNEGVKSPLPKTIRDSFPETKTDWNFVKAIVLGYVVGLTIVISPLLFYKRWRNWYYMKVDPILLVILDEQNYRRKIRQRRSRRNTIQRLQ